VSQPARIVLYRGVDNPPMNTRRACGVVFVVGIFVLAAGLARVGTAVRTEGGPPHPLAAAVSPAVISPQTTSPVTSVTVGSHPGGLAYDSGNGDVYVVDTGSQQVSVINGTSVVATIGIGMSAGCCGSNIAYDATNGYVYVANQGSSNVSVINGTSLLTTVAVGDYPVAVAYDSGNGYIYVVNQFSANVTVLQGSSVIGWVGVGGSPNTAIYDPGNGDVYVANGQNDNVTVINGLGVVGNVATGVTPDAFAYDSTNGYVYVGASGNGATIGNTVTVVQDATSIANVTVGNGPDALAFDSANGYVYVANGGTTGTPSPSNNLSVINGVSVVATLPMGITPGGYYGSGIAYSGSTQDVYVANYQSSNVSLVAGTSVVGSATVGLAPFGVVVDNGTGDVYVTNSLGTTVSVLGAAPPPSYLVSFSQSGLPTDTEWSVSLNGVLVTSTSSSSSFEDTNGTYGYTITDVPGWHQSTLPYTGSLQVRGHAVTEPTLGFSQFTLEVTFDETGLPSSTNWSVTMIEQGTTNSLAGTSVGSSQPLTAWSDGAASVELMAPNGTYSYSSFAAGYSNATGTVTVSGHPVPSVAVAFSAPSSPSSSSWLEYAIIAGVIVVVLVVVLLAVARSRRGKGPAPPATIGTSPPPPSN
jgi:YVTN family beta-propeller protein